MSSELPVVQDGNVRIVEGTPDRPLLARVVDANRVIEACWSGGASLALLYAANLPEAFFDLSSREAGGILQKFRNYGIRLAVVCPEGSIRFSSRFREMVAEEQMRRHFAVFETRDEALEWLAR
jgi:hypothetical protein